MDFQIGISLPFQVPAGSPLPRTFPALTAAIETVAADAQRRWVAYASGAPLPDGRRINSRTGAYARSIQMIRKSDLEYRVESRARQAQPIESGTRAYDLKQMLRTSAKVRLTKAGKRYLVIPFRHGTPGSVGFASTMPEHVHELARALTASRVKGTARVPNVIGLHDARTRMPVMVTRRAYTWGDRLPAGLSSKRASHHRTDPYAGLARFDAPQGRHSQFLTFRVMSEDSRGWIRAAQPGYWPARTVAREIEGPARRLFAQALAHDLERHLSR